MESIWASSMYGGNFDTCEEEATPTKEPTTTPKTEVFSLITTKETTTTEKGSSTEEATTSNKGKKGYPYHTFTFKIY